MAGRTADEIKTLGLDSSLQAVCDWAGMGTELQVEWAKLLGFPEGVVGTLHPRVLATVPEPIYHKFIQDWEVAFFQKSLAMQVYTAAKPACSLPAPPPEAA